VDKNEVSTAGYDHKLELHTICELKMDKNEVNAVVLRASELRTSCESEMDGANAVALKVRFTHQL